MERPGHKNIFTRFFYHPLAAVPLFRFLKNKIMLPKDLTSDIKARLNSIKGQIEGIVKMLDEAKEPGKILIQFKAADKGLQKAHYLLLDEVYRKALAIKIVNAVDKCPGNCGNEDRIEYIKQQFPHLELDELSEKIVEMKEIEEHLSRHNAEKNHEGKKS
jgi:CsoR family transcriptional regulator, copper-sensing transcriptional repressor